MFQIPVWDLLASYAGDNQELAFDGPVYDGYYEDISIIGNLKLQLKLIGLDDGIEVLIYHLSALVRYEWIERKVNVNIPDWQRPIARKFLEKHDPLAPDDIKFIDIHSSTIDLKDVIREELLLELMNY